MAFTKLCLEDQGVVTTTLAAITGIDAVIIGFVLCKAEELVLNLVSADNVEHANALRATAPRLAELREALIREANLPQEAGSWVYKPADQPPSETPPDNDEFYEELPSEDRGGRDA
jgi:hypothetical protein